MKPVEITEWIWTNKTKLEFECYLNGRLVIGALGARYMGPEDAPRVWINELDTEFYGQETLICEHAADLIYQEPVIMQRLYENSETSDGDRTYDAWREDQ